MTSDGIWWKFDHESRRVPLDAEDNTVCGVRGAQRGQMVNGSDPSLDEGKPRLDLSFNFLPQRCSTGTCDLCSLPLCPFFPNRSLTKQRCVPWKEGRRKRHPPHFPAPTLCSKVSLTCQRQRLGCFERFCSRPKICMEACVQGILPSPMTLAVAQVVTEL